MELHFSVTSLSLNPARVLSVQLRQTGRTGAALRRRPLLNKLCQNKCLSSTLLHSTLHQLHTCLEISHAPVWTLLSPSTKRLFLTCTFSSLASTLHLHVDVICRHPSFPLSPRQQDRQRVIKTAPAALCLMSLSAHQSLAATSQPHAGSV